jgi:hypothetical protein
VPGHAQGDAEAVDGFGGQRLRWTPDIEDLLDADDGEEIFNDMVAYDTGK